MQAPAKSWLATYWPLILAGILYFSVAGPDRSVDTAGPLQAFHGSQLRPAGFAIAGAKSLRSFQ